MITNGKTYRFINPRFLDSPLTATHSASSQYAYLRKRTRQTPDPGAHRLFQLFKRQLDADRLASAGGGRCKTAAFHVRQLRSDIISPAPSLHLVVATRLCAPRVRVGGPVSHKGILHASCDRRYRATSWHMSLGNHCRPRHRLTPQTRPHDFEPHAGSL